MGNSLQETQLNENSLQQTKSKKLTPGNSDLGTELQETYFQGQNPGNSALRNLAPGNSFQDINSRKLSSGKLTSGDQLKETQPKEMLQDQITVLTFDGMATEISGAHECHTQNQQAKLK